MCQIIRRNRPNGSTHTGNGNYTANWCHHSGKRSWVARVIHQLRHIRLGHIESTRDRLLRFYGSISGRQMSTDVRDLQKFGPHQPVISFTFHVIDCLLCRLQTNSQIHWLRASQRIEYKVAVLTYKVLHGSALRYLGPLVSDNNTCIYKAGGHCVLPAPIALWCLPSGSLPSVAGPSRLLLHASWNALPAETTWAQSLTSFRRHLKSWLFSQSYPDLIINFHVVWFPRWWCCTK